MAAPASTLRYYTDFMSCAAFRHEHSAHYRLEIHGPTGSSRQLTLAGDDPVVIEWQTVSKTEPVQGSSLTLRLVSASDREFTHLYTTEVGEWWIKVFRNEELYWTGILDTELYEEPYITDKGYEVEITFSDFGALDRLDFEGAGVLTLAKILNDALTPIKLDSLEIEHTRSTMVADEIPTGSYKNFNFEDVSIEADNFYNEDEEPMSQREVLEAILQPLACRMVQRNGKIKIFDLNGIYEKGDEEEVYWADVNTQLGTDVTYNKVTVTLSTYANTEGISGESDHDTALEGNSGVKYMIDTDWEATKNGENAEGFYLACGKEDTETIHLCNGQNMLPFLMRMDSVFSGQDCVGVVWAAYGNTQDNFNSGLTTSGLSGYNGGIFPIGGPINFANQDEDWAKAEYENAKGDTFVPIFELTRELSIASVLSKKHLLKLTMDLLLDARYNPFENAGDFNEEENYKKMEENFHIVYIPFRLTLYTNTGTRYQYTNWRQINRLDKPISTHWQWEGATAGNDKVWSCLAYYSDSDPMKNSGVGGWATNKQSIGDPRLATKLMTRRGDGEFIPLPPYPGTLKLEIGRGLCWRYDKKLRPGWYRDGSYLYNRLRWLAYKNPKLELVKKDGSDEEGEDIVDSAWIVKSAKESLDLDLTVGSPGSTVVPTSRAFLRYAVSGNVIPKFQRAGVTERLERLLIGTVYSQYATRRTTLSGTCELISGMPTLTDAADPDGKYIMLGDVQHLIKEESEITIAQYGPDDYEGLEITSE